VVVLANTFESGSIGTDITTGNSGSATSHAFDAVTKGAGATLAYNSANLWRGGLSMTYQTGATSAAANVTWTTSLGASSTTMYARLYVKTTGFGQTNVLIRIRSGGAQIGRLSINSAGGLDLRQGNNSTVDTSTALSANVWYRVELKLTSGSAQTAECRIYTASTGVLFDTVTGSGAYGTGTIDEVGFGHAAASSNCPLSYMDDIALSTADWIGPSEQNSTVADTVGVDVAAAGAFVAGRALTAAVAAADGTSRLVARPRTPTDTLTAADSATRARTGGRAAADTLGAGDTTGRGVTAPRTPADTLTAADVPSRLPFGYSRAAANSLTTVDGVGRAVAGGRGLVDTFGVDGAAGRTFTAPRAPAELAGFGDVPAGQTSTARQLASSVSVPATPGTGAAIFATTAELVTAGNVLAGWRQPVRAVADTVTAAASSSFLPFFAIVVPDSVLLVDGLTRGLTTARNATSVVGVEGTAVAQRNLPPNLIRPYPSTVTGSGPRSTVSATAATGTIVRSV
jgi:hypothetical protein